MASPLSVLVLPSWSPHRCFPLEGVFLRDQAVAVGEMRPDWKVGLSLWAQGEGRLSLAHLRRSPHCLASTLLPKGPAERERAPNVVEFDTPTVTWSESFLHGNRDGLLAAGRKNLARARRRFGHVDLLHAHVSYPAGWVAMRLSDETGLPYVVTEHMGPFPLGVYARRDGRLEPWIREPLERAHARMAVSPALCERIASFGIPRPAYVPNVVDERWNAPPPPTATDAGPGDAPRPFTFFTLCQMEKVKAIPDLLAAIRLLLDRVTPGERARLRFRMGGYGTQFEAFRAESRRLELDPWVTWLGFLERERSRAEYAGCDAFVLPSHHESFGVVVVEAAAFGKPVVATRSGGPDSIVRPDTGILVEPGDPPALSRAMERIWRGECSFDPAVIRASFLREYSRGAVVDQLERIYRGAIATAKRP